MTEPSRPGEELDAGSADAGDLGAVLRLLEEGAPLADFPGPLLVLEPGQRVVAANPPAARFVHLVRSERAVSLSALTAAAVGSAKPQTLKIADDETGQSVEFVAIPIGATGRALLVGRDVTLDQNLRSALIDSRQRYKDLVEISSDFAWEIGPSGTFVFVSPGGALGYTPEELVGRRVEEFVDAGLWSDARLPFLARDRVEAAEVWFRRADGGLACLLASAAPLRDDKGEWRGARGVCRDVTEERRREQALARARNREQLLAYIVRTIRDEVEPLDMLASAAAAVARALAAEGCAIYRIDGEGTAMQGAKFGAPPAGDALDATLARLRSEEGPLAVAAGDCLLLGRRTLHQGRVNGALWLWRGAEGPDWLDDDLAVVAEVADQLAIAIEQIANHEKLQEMSRTDELTGLLNRRTFFEHLRRQVDRRGARRTSALAYVDLDNFKQVNDRLGHQAGDRALKAVAGLLEAACREGDTVARLGGDEFAVWLDGMDAAAAGGWATRLLGRADVLVEHSAGPDRPLGFSIGLAVWVPESGETLEQLIARADAAMYAVKRRGKGTYTLAPPAGEAGEAAVGHG